MSKSFVVYIKEGAVLPNWPAHIGLPIVEIIEGRRCSDTIVEELIGVYSPPVPRINCIAVEGVRPGLGDVNYLGPGILTVLGGISVIDDVQKDLLELMGIGDDRWNVVGEFAFQRNVVDS